ncbi:unnamed protein product [Cylicostephanus goldi]|uniref:t-SNARE coiled-coil homology domain-containing protein n=1 Tax=Cylicostephanus goldi TaxID=71465 RepID=A0A3P6QLA4_CYLGO|nr:unnamed protein product [Cylicostephanus goldi]
MWKFNEEEENYKERCKKKITDYLKIRGPFIEEDIKLTDDEISDAIDNGDIFERTKGILLAYSDKKALFEDVKARRDELFEIEKVIRELGEMFVDLNNLVMSQGEMLDRIETNIEDAVDYAEKAKQNVKDARELMKKARKVQEDHNLHSSRHTGSHLDYLHTGDDLSFHSDLLVVPYFYSVKDLLF